MVALEEMNNSNRKNRDEAERNRKSNQTADDGEDHKKGKGSSHTALRRKRSGSGKGVGQSGGDDLQTSAQQGLRDDSSKAWVMRTLFRTAENERGPSRTRAKAVSFASDVGQSETETERAHTRRRRRHRRQASKGSTTSSGEDDAGRRDDDQRKLTKSSHQGSRPPLTPSESDRSVESEGTGLRRRKKRAATWHSAQNPLFKPKQTQEEQEVVPLYVFFYEAVLNLLWPPFNYFRLHLLYICFLSVFGGLAIYLSQLGLSSEMSYLDALVHGASTSTQTGLFPTNFSAFSRLGQVILAVVMVLGNGVLITIAPVVTRLFHFHRFFKQKNITQKTDEYYALWQLVIIVPTYYCVFVGLGWIVMGSYMAGASDANGVIDKNDNNAAWWGLFHSLSAFGNCGYSTFGDGMVQWQTYPLPLIIMSILILAGNTAFPLLMRLIIYTLWRTPFLKRYRHVYRYMLDHPRRCFTHLFPAAETRWLLVVLVFLNSVEFIFELVLDWDNAAYLQLSPSYKLLNMYFQTIAIRTSGFNSVDLTKLSASILWLYTGMMYIAASPVAITVRYTGKASADSIEASGRTTQTTNTVGSQAQNIFVKHFVFVFLAILFISMIEEIPLAVDPNYTLFKVIFEVVSAYGTVGLSLGYGSFAFSFCGVWSGGSKFILALVMILGKHRNLPESIDSAVTMPTDLMFDETDAASDIEVLSESDNDDVFDDDDDDEAALDDDGESEYDSDEVAYEEEKSEAADSGEHKKTKKQKKKAKTDKSKSKSGGHGPTTLRFEDDDIPPDMDDDDQGWLHGGPAPSSSDEDVERGTH